MNICFISHEYAHPSLPPSGGIGVFVRSLATELVTQGHNVYVLGYANNSFEGIDNGVQVTFIRSLQGGIKLLLKRDKAASGSNVVSGSNYRITESNLKRLLVTTKAKVIDITQRLFKDINSARLNLKLAKTIKDHQIEIVEVNDYLGLAAKLSIEVPLVIRCHGSYTVLMRGLNSAKKGYILEDERKQFLRTENIIATSKSCQRDVEAHFSKKKVTLIYNGLPPLQSSESIDIPSTPKGRYIFYYGAIAYSKGVDILIRVFNSIAKTDAAIRLVLSGKDYGSWSEIINNNRSGIDAIDSRVTYLGHVSKEDLAVHLQNASLCVFPTLAETMPLSWLEAMRAGKAILVSKIPVSPEIIENGVNGYICVTEEDYVRTGKLLLSDAQQRDTIGRTAAETVEEKFSMRQLVSATINYYSKLINQNLGS